MHNPRWLDNLERKFSKYAIPHLAYVVVGTQVFGILLQLMSRNAINRMVLHPDLVMAGDWWRIITFIAVPQVGGLSSFMGMLVLFIFLWFLYFVVSALEESWGPFKTSLYIVTAWVLTVSFSFIFSQPVAGILYLEMTLLLAAGVLFGEHEILLYFVLPVKMKWLAWLTAGIVLYQFFSGGYLTKIYLAMVFANYFIFFGSYHIEQYRQAKRRRDFKNSIK